MFVLTYSHANAEQKIYTLDTGRQANEKKTKKQKKWSEMSKMTHLNTRWRLQQTTTGAQLVRIENWSDHFISILFYMI